MRIPIPAAILTALLLCVSSSRGQASAQSENRFLFLIDTARAMRGYSNDIVHGVMELMASDMHGEFRDGDTIGLWTYNETLHPDFPMQVWSKANKNSIINETAQFLLAQTYEKQAHLDKVLPALNQVIHSSERITVIIFFDGYGIIKGTPYDAEINALQKKYARELKRAHLPFVTVLAARNGAVFDYTINYPGVIAIPHTANPEKVIPTNAPPVVAAPAPPPKPRRGPSIIMSHSTNLTQLAQTPPVQPKAKPQVAAPAPQPAPKSVAATPAKPASVAANVPAPAPQPRPAVATPTPIPTPAPAPQAKVASPPLDSTAKPAPKPEPTVQKAAPVVAIPAPPAEPKAALQPPPAPAVTAPVIPPEPTPSVSPAPAPATVPAPVAALAAPVVERGSPAGLIIAISLLAVAIVIAAFLLRRTRSAPQSSLISQSIDRPR